MSGCHYTLGISHYTPNVYCGCPCHLPTWNSVNSPTCWCICPKSGTKIPTNIQYVRDNTKEVQVLRETLKKLEARTDKLEKTKMQHCKVCQGTGIVWD